MLLGAALDLCRRIVVEALNGRNFFRLGISDILHAHEVFAREKLRDKLINVERFHKEFAAVLKVLLSALRFFLFGHNVNVPARKLRGQTHILPVPADRQRQFTLRHDGFDAVAIVVDNDLGNLRRLKPIDDEGRGVFKPGNDINFLALQLADHRLNARAPHTNASANGINGTLARDDRDFRPTSRVPRDALDLHDTFINLRHLLSE